MTMRKIGNRLIWTHSEEPAPDFWDNWFSGKGALQEKISSLMLSHTIDSCETVLLEYLPKAGKILEAGCGYGRVLIPLMNRGFDIEGIEYSKRLVDEINRSFPQVPIRWGDATAIDKPSGYYAGYLSLGVMEHVIEGPGVFLDECFRVLAPGGVAFISVPFYDFLWQLRSPWLLKGWPDEESEEVFFQWHFTRNEFISLVEKSGLKVQKAGSYGVRYGALRSVPFWGWLQRRRGGHRLWKMLGFLEGRANATGWMQWAIARRPE